jgi:hypothetical protein
MRSITSEPKAVCSGRPVNGDEASRERRVGAVRLEHHLNAHAPAEQHRRLDARNRGAKRSISGCHTWMPPPRPPQKTSGTPSSVPPA